MSTVVNCVEYEAGRRRAERDLREACPAVADGSFIWVGLHEPNQELLRTVQQRFSLHDLAIEDALLAHQRPKLEIYGDSVFIALRTAQLVDHKLQFGETHIFAGRGYVVTVRHGSTTAYREVRARCENAPKMLARGESFVVYSIIDFIVDNYFPVLHGLEAEADALEEEVFSHRTDRADVERIYELRHELLLLRRAVQRHPGPRDPGGGGDRQSARPVDRGAGSEPAAGVAGAEPGNQKADRLGGHLLHSARDRVGLRHELQMDA
jgi:magnesium transporter